MPLTQRRAGILRLVVHEYIETASPVGSKAIHDKYALPASPATIRNEMQALEGDGLLIHPHTSAGRVPSDEGYRFFVESLMGQVDLSDEVKATKIIGLDNGKVVEQGTHQELLENDGHYSRQVTASIE